MKNSLFLLLFFLFSCGDKVEVSGHRVEQLRELSGYSQINVSSGIQTVINFGEEDVVSVKTFESVQPYVECLVKNGVLYVKMVDGIRFNHDTNVIVTINARNISDLSLSGGSSTTSSSSSFFSTNGVHMNLSGGSFFDGEVATDNMNIELGGGSNMRLMGTSQNLEMNCSGGASIDANKFSTNVLSIELSGGSRCEINVNDRINKASLSGGSRLVYSGTRLVSNVNVSGGSDLISNN